MQGADGSASTTGAIRGPGPHQREAGVLVLRGRLRERERSREGERERFRERETASTPTWLARPRVPTRAWSEERHCPCMSCASTLAGGCGFTVRGEAFCLSEPSVKWCMLACPSTRSSARHRLAHKHLLTHSAGRQHSSWPCPWCDGSSDRSGLWLVQGLVC